MVVEENSVVLNDEILLLNNPLLPCSEISPFQQMTHGDAQAFPFQIEKERNHTHGENYARSFRFKGKFRSECEYNLGNQNQLDWNKLMSISEKPMSIFNSDETSIRLGWRWSIPKNKMELGLYGHINHDVNNVVGREFLYLTEVNLDEDFFAELILSGIGMGVIVNGKGSFIKREDILDEGTVKTVLKRNAFFGGQECPPHFMRIQLEDLKADGFTNWNTSTCYKTFSRSFFYDYDNFDVTASNDIILSEQVFRGQFDSNSSNSFNNTIPAGFVSGDEIPWFESQGQRYVKILNGADVRFKAGNKISLLPGFRAEPGSKFSATIEPIECGSFNLRTANISTDTIEEINNETKAITKGTTSLLSNNPLAEFVAIFPNPTQNNFTISATENIMQYSIYDISGKWVLNQENVGTSKLEVSAENLQAGIYFVNIITPNQNETKKLMIAK
jgi:hypothetical protein